MSNVVVFNIERKQTTIWQRNRFNRKGESIFQRRLSLSLCFESISASVLVLVDSGNGKLFIHEMLYLSATYAQDRPVQ